MPAEPQPPTVAEVVNRAVDVCDPMGAHEALAELQARWEDADEPVRGAVDLEQRIAESIGAIDPDGDDPALLMAAAVVTYLAFRRDEVADDRESILRLAARAEFDAEPPPHVSEWLATQGVEL
jgi:hypothetical protein